MKTRKLVTALAAAAMVVQFGGGIASAHVTPLEFQFNPSSGAAGTVLHVTNGHGCPPRAGTVTDGVFLLASSGGTPGAPLEFESDADGHFAFDYSTTNMAPGAYVPTIQCYSSGLGGIGSLYTVDAPPPPPGSTYFPIAPARVLDTREGIGAAANEVGPDGVIEVKVAGVLGVPANARAVALNVTVTNASGPESHLKVWPTGSPQPFASNLNFNAGTSIPNLVIARVGTDGKVSMRNNLGTVDVVADIQGWYANEGDPGARYVPLNPQRILDTREGLGAAAAQVGAGGIIEVAVTGVADVPANATAVVLNTTVDRATGPESFLTVWPSGNSRPTASNLNFIGGPATTNLVIARVGAGGKVGIYNNQGATDVIADVQGYFTAAGATTGSLYNAMNPVRTLDSREGLGTPGNAVGQLGEGATIDLQVAGVGGVPATGVTSVVLNVTVTGSPGPESYVTLFPSGTARQLVSNLNYSPGETVPNLVIVRVNNGKVSIYNNQGSTNVVADVQGYFTG